MRCVDGVHLERDLGRALERRVGRERLGHLLGRPEVRVESDDEFVETVARNRLARAAEPGGGAAESDLGEPQRVGAIVGDEDGAGCRHARFRVRGQCFQVGIDDGILDRRERRVQVVRGTRLRAGEQQAVPVHPRAGAP